MARTLTEIQNSIIATKETRPELARLTSSSAVAVWRLWTWVVAVAIQFHEMIFDQFKAEVETSIASRQAGTPPWYVEQVYKFQAGDQVEVIGGKPGYATIDPEKQIVTRAAYREVDDDGYTVLQLRVAKGDTGSEGPLTVEEQFQLRTYLTKVKFAGTKIQVISLNPDLLRLSAEVYYDGVYDLDTVKANVEAAITNYLQNLDFDGQIYVNRIIDAVQGVDGVIDIDVITTTAVVGGTPTVIDRVYLTSAGYIIPDETPGNSFDDLITYVAQ